MEVKICPGFWLVSKQAYSNKFSPLFSVKPHHGLHVPVSEHMEFSRPHVTP